MKVCRTSLGRCAVLQVLALWGLKCEGVPYFIAKVCRTSRPCVHTRTGHMYYTTLTSRWNPMWWVEPSLDEFGHPSSRPFACSACVKCLSNGWSPGWLNLATRRVGPLHALPSESASVMKPWTRRALPVVKAFKALDTEGRALVKVRARRMN